jgi:hypothetical protein
MREGRGKGRGKGKGVTQRVSGPRTWVGTEYWAAHRDYFAVDERARLDHRGGAARTATVLTTGAPPASGLEGRVAQYYPASPPPWDPHSAVMEHHITDTNHYSHPLRPWTAGGSSSSSPRVVACPSPRVLLGDSSTPRRIPALQSRLCGVPERLVGDELLGLTPTRATPAGLAVSPPESPSQQMRSRRPVSNRAATRASVTHRDTGRSDWMHCGAEPSNYVASHSPRPSSSPAGRGAKLTDRADTSGLVAGRRRWETPTAQMRALHPSPRSGRPSSTWARAQGPDSDVQDAARRTERGKRRTGLLGPGGGSPDKGWRRQHVVMQPHSAPIRPIYGR